MGAKGNNQTKKRVIEERPGSVTIKNCGENSDIKITVRNDGLITICRDCDSIAKEPFRIDANQAANGELIIHSPPPKYEPD